MLSCPMWKLEFSNDLEVKILILKDEIKEQEKNKGREMDEEES